MTSNIIVFHCPSCDSKLQVPSQMAGVTGPCPECSANITAPATSTEPSSAAPIPTKVTPVQKPEHAPQATPPIDPPLNITEMRQAVTEQSERPQAQPVPQQVVQPFGNQAGHLAAERPKTPNTPAQITDYHGGQRPLGARWLAVILPLAFLAVACLLILAILQLTGIYNLRDSGASNIQPSTKPDTTSKNIPETPVRDSKDSQQDNSEHPNSDELSDNALPIDPSGTPTAETGELKPETDKPTKLTSPAIKNPNKEQKFPESKLPASTASELSSDPDSSKPQEAAVATPAATPTAPPKTAPTPLAKDKASDPSKVGFVANQNLENFLKLTTLDERLPLMSKSKLSPEELKTSSLAGELKPVKSIQLMKIVPRAEDNMTQHLYSVSFEDPEENRQRLRILMQLVERPGIHPPLVHADAFLEHYDKKLTQYAKQPSKGITTLHCIAEARTSDLAKELPEELKKSMVRLAIKSHPYDSTIFNAYLHKKSPLMEHIGSNKKFPYTSARLCVLSFLWNTTDPKHPYIELKDIVALTWEK